MTPDGRPGRIVRLAMYGGRGAGVRDGVAAGMAMAHSAVKPASLAFEP